MVAIITSCSTRHAVKGGLHDIPSEWAGVYIVTTPVHIYRTVTPFDMYAFLLDIALGYLL